MADDVNKNEPATGWWSGLDADHQTLVTSRGYDKLAPEQAAVELAKAYRGSEKLRGGLAAGDVVALPKSGDIEAAKAFWQKVGTPEKPEGYTFEGLTKKDGTALDAGYTDAARAAAASVNMPAHMLKDFIGQMQPHFDGQADNNLARRTIDIDASRRELAMEWGANEARNKFVAGRAMQTLKLAPETVSALETLPGMGYKAVMNMMLQLGEQMGEGRFVTGEVAGTMTPDQAQARLDTLKGDAAWGKRWAEGGSNEREELSRLAAIIRGSR